MKIEHEIDVEGLKKIIDEALDFNENEMIFGQLSAVTTAKKELEASLKKVEEVEKEAKGLINAKAKALYGTDWKVIAGRGYKITRSNTGAVYTTNPEVKVSKKFLKVVESVDTKAVELALEKTEKLPKGIEYNPKRGESLRITVDENTKD